jgi:hypothetical protein
MSLTQLLFQTNQIGRKRSHCILALCFTLAAGLALAPSAKAAFVGDYALSHFTLTNMNADGSVLTPDSGLSIILTGGNNGSGLSGTTDLVGAATGTGVVQFHYSYSSLDFPGVDFAGFLAGGAFSQLASADGQSGNAMFTVSAGQSFGFRVATQDNTGEPGILTISNFTAPFGSGPAAVPEPGTASLMAVGAAGAFAAQRRARVLWLRKEAA